MELFPAFAHFLKCDKSKIINMLSLIVELKTSRLLNECSNQLSYESITLFLPYLNFSYTQAIIKDDHRATRMGKKKQAVGFFQSSPDLSLMNHYACRDLL
jgi:hypothetical protein